MTKESGDEMVLVDELKENGSPKGSENPEKNEKIESPEKNDTENILAPANKLLPNLKVVKTFLNFINSTNIK